MLHSKHSCVCWRLTHCSLLSDLAQHPPTATCNLLQFLYDTWYACLTPDREFPAEVRRILNTAFGQASGGATGFGARPQMLHGLGPGAVQHSAHPVFGA